MPKSSPSQPKKPLLNPVSPEAREAFKAYVRVWQEKLNLLDWRIYVSSKAAAKSDAAVADMIDIEARLARIRLGNDLGDDTVDERTVEELALHEVLHVFLREFKSFAEEPGANPADVNSAEHRVIITLTNALLGQRL